jgi:hypothetical protein
MNSWAWVPWDSRPYFILSDSILPFLSFRTTRSVAVDVFDPASTWDFYGGIRVRVKVKSYFMIGGLPPITSSWRQAPWDSRPELFFQLNTCGNSPYVTPLWREDGFVSYEYAWPYNMLLKFFILHCKQHYTTSHVVWDESLKAGSHLYASLKAVYWAHRAICTKCYASERHMNSSSHFIALT